MRSPFVAALLSASIAWTPLSSATAQQSTERQTAFESLADSQWVRLSSPDVDRHEGRLLERTTTDLVISGDPHSLRLPATAVDTLWTRGSSVGRGALIGAVAGALFGTVVGVAAAGSSSDQNITAGDGVLVGGGGGLVVGALLGGLTGLAIPKWHRRYP